RQLDGQRRDLEREAKQMVIEFALKVAEKLVHRVIEVDPSVVTDQVAGALAHVLRPLEVIVRLNPEDQPILQEALPDLMDEFQRLEHVKLVEDAEVTRGGCVVTYGEGEIDATIETQIRRVIDLILPDGPTPSEPAVDVVSGAADVTGITEEDEPLPDSE